MPSFFYNKNYGKLLPSPSFFLYNTKVKTPPAPNRNKLACVSVASSLPETVCCLRLNYFFVPNSLFGGLEAMTRILLGISVTAITPQPHMEQYNIDSCPGSISHASNHVRSAWGYEMSPNSPRTAEVGSCTNPNILLPALICVVLDSA